MNIDISIFSLIAQADIVVKMIMLLLATASIFSWGIVFEKIFSLRQQSKKINQFERAFWSGQALDRFYSHMKMQKNNIIVNIFNIGMEQLQKEERTNIAIQDLRASLARSMEISCNVARDKIEHNLFFLATIGSVSPFIGLFGTVWGIMSSFQSIALSQNNNLTVVAPSIAEALLATAGGIFVAIPAVIFYNKIVSDTDRLFMRIEHFISEFSDILVKK